MKASHRANKRAITIRDLYPELSPEQQQEAAYRLHRYLDIIRRIYERKRKLTEPGQRPRL